MFLWFCVISATTIECKGFLQKKSRFTWKEKYSKDRVFSLIKTFLEIPTFSRYKISENNAEVLLCGE